MKFSSDWLMPSVKHNSITANATTLIFSLFDIASAQVGIPQYVQFILYVLTSVLLGVTFIFAEAKSVNLVVAHNGFLCM